ncbi:hypothetical protein Hanom_Chr12g01082421 [Helianthus anomalus]
MNKVIKLEETGVLAIYIVFFFLDILGLSFYKVGMILFCVYLKRCEILGE